MAAAAQIKSQRRPQERADETRRKLLEAAIKEFSERGYDGATTRNIEARAAVQKTLLRYHFGSKKDLWKAAAGEMIAKMRGLPEWQSAIFGDLPFRERLTLAIRSHVRLAAANPALNRLIIQEGKHDSWRMHWLVDHYLLPAMRRLKRQIGADLNLSAGAFMHWYYLLIGGGVSIFSMAPEAQQVFGVNVQDKQFVDRHAKIMVEFLTPRTGS